MTELKLSKKFASKTILVSTALIVLCGTVNAQNISPAQRQEYADAKNEIDNALKLPSAKYAPVELKQAQESLQTAEKSFSTNDATKYGQFTRLARAQAQLTIALTDLGVETERSADTKLALQKAKDEIAQLITAK